MNVVAILTCMIVSAVVAPDGTGDYATIQAAVDAVPDGHVVELTDGVFTGPGNVDVQLAGRSLTIRSLSGNPDACIVDCEGSPAEPHRAINLTAGDQRQADQGPNEVIITGIQFRNGWMADFGGAILCDDVLLTIDDCGFVNNHSDLHGGAICTFDVSANIVNTHFVTNSAMSGGAVSVQHFGSGGRILGCRFDGNSATERGGAVEFISSLRVDVEFSTFVNNVADQGGALYGYPSIRRCTLTANEAKTRGGAIVVRQGIVPQGSFDYSIFWGNCAPEAAEIYLAGASPGATCSLIDTTGVVEGGPFPAPGIPYVNLVAEDPLFCAPLECGGSGGTDVRVSPASPAHPDNNACGAWIGVSDETCNIVPVVPVSWSRLKSLHR